LFAIAIAVMNLKFVLSQQEKQQKRSKQFILGGHDEKRI